MTNNESPQKRTWLDRPLFPDVPALTVELVLFAIILILMAVSRLYDLGSRVMSYDESLHVYFSWLYSIGQGYQYNPTTHGPLQFHLIALSYLLFGDSDFTARLPAAMGSIATVLLLWKWRRYLGRAGTLVAAGLFLISPFMLYYGRYARNEVFVALLGVLTLYAILRYLESGNYRYLLLLTIATALQFTVKETAFIYTAQAILFLALYLLVRVLHAPWKKKDLQNGSAIGLAIGLLLSGAAIGLTFYNGVHLLSGYDPTLMTLISLACISFIGTAVFFIAGYGWKALCVERSFSMLILLGTFVLPQLAAIPDKALGWDPLAYQFTWPGLNIQALWSQGPFRTAVVLLVLIVLSVAIGLLWNCKLWLLNAAIFWGIYIFFYTSIFTNWPGLAVGMVGSLGYWLAQQGVQRGNQPWYYYLLLQIPIYEYLPAIGVGLAVFFGIRRKNPAPLAPVTSSAQMPAAEETLMPPPTFNLLLCWVLTSVLAFSIAGEKMPWLTVHIALPMILLAAWGLGQVIERVDWSQFGNKATLAVILLVILFLSLTAVLLILLGTQAPFQGKTLAQLSATSVFLFSITVSVASAIGLIYILARWQIKDTLRLAVLVIFGLLAIQTARTATRAAYLHPNDATEFLVYAHGASGVKEVMAQIATLSERTVGGQLLTLAYDSSSPNAGVAWPFTWYLRHYTNKTSFDQPGPTLKGVPVILVAQKNFDAIKPIIGSDYYQITYIRIVWPNQDYFNLNWTRIKAALIDPSMRAALWEIWFNRDYSLYAKDTGNDNLTVPTWSPSDKIELLIRKDLAAEIWGYGILQKTAVQTDPYAKAKITLPADLSIGSPGTAQAQFDAPHGMAAAPDGSIYVADTDNNRIQHFAADGSFLNSWGSFADNNIAGAAPIGTFNQPWDVAVSPDGKYVYVADTWNHRIQKFTADGAPVKMWGKASYDPAKADPYGIWGPRGIAVDARGHVFVADTGNKRVLIYDQDGNFLAQIGNEGLDVGQFEEPVGLAIDQQGDLFVADTWNQRIQVFSVGQDGITFSPSLQWNIAGWYGESLDNKPYLAFDSQGHLFVTDPESFRVLEFSTKGDLVRTWGDYGIDTSSFGLAAGVSVDPGGHVWVSDPVNNRLVRFTLP